jgi:hypothetical protein
MLKRSASLLPVIIVLGVALARGEANAQALPVGDCDCGAGPFPVLDQAACFPPCTFTPGSGPTGESQNPTGDGTVTLPNPLGESDPRVLIGQVVRVALGIVGSLALLLFLYGGLMWLTSSGNTERIKHGRDTLVWSTIGLIVIFSSYAVVNFIIQSVPRVAP